jgi:ABC-2 type transport system permease protein/lipopolysaccharide transport system permease protein
MDESERASAPPSAPGEASQDFRAVSARERRAEYVSATADASELLTEDEVETEIAEEEATHRVVPRVKPRKTEDLDIEPPSRQHYAVNIRSDLRELWAHRELGYTLVERDLRVRYKQAVLGGVWAVVQPLVLMVLFTVVFNKIAKITVPGVPYAAFSYTGLVAWGFFAGSIGYGTNAVLSNASIIRKIYCPRELFPITSVASSGFDYLISLVISVGFILFYGFLGARPNLHPGITWLAFPLVLVILLALMTAATLFVSAVTVYFRDTRYGIPLLLQILLYGTPVAYPMELLTGGTVNGHTFACPEQCPALGAGFFAHAYPYLNPLAPVIDGFHRIFLYREWPMWGPLASAAVVGFGGLVLLYRWYKRIDRTFADVI